MVASSVIIKNPAEIAASASARAFDLALPREVGRDRVMTDSMLEGCRQRVLSATTGWLTL
jgi:hypothetical protein